MNGGTSTTVDRAAIRDCLEEVYDPELDRSIVELEYVDEISIREDRVDVSFVLPTAWCSPAFAWMMARDVREEVGVLAGVSEVHVELLDHMHDEQINRGVNEGLAFQEVFEDAEDGVEAVGRRLDRKARLARQYRAVETLLDAGLDPAQIVELTGEDVERVDDRVVVYLRDRTVGVTVPAEPMLAYLEKARAVDVVADAGDRLFAGPDGEPIEAANFESVHRDARLAKSNVSGQAGICAALHEARNGVEAGGD